MTRRIIDLGGNDWRFGCARSKPLEPQVDARAEVKEWLPTTVPRNVRANLPALGLIEDPFHGTNNETSQWVDAYDWWYARPLTVDLEARERAFTVFEGIDYISAVYLDHFELGRHGVAQQKPGEREGTPLALHSPLHIVACAQLLRKPAT